jgi:hypothetical protein
LYEELVKEHKRMELENLAAGWKARPGESGNGSTGSNSAQAPVADLSSPASWAPTSPLDPSRPSKASGMVDARDPIQKVLENVLNAMQAPNPPDEIVLRYWGWITEEERKQKLAAVEEFVQRAAPDGASIPKVKRMLTPELLESMGEGHLRASIFPVPPKGTRLVDVYVVAPLLGSTYMAPLVNGRALAGRIQEVTKNGMSREVKVEAGETVDVACWMVGQDETFSWADRFKQMDPVTHVRRAWECWQARMDPVKASRLKMATPRQSILLYEAELLRRVLRRTPSAGSKRSKAPR